VLSVGNSTANNLSVPEPGTNWLKIEYLWISVPVFLLIWSSFLHRLPLFDFWWHLKTGEIIVNEHRLPRFDEFSYTAAGTPSLPQAWLAQIIYYLTYRAGGPALLIAMNTALLLAALLVVLKMCMTETGRHIRLVALAALVPASVLAAYSHIRPQVFSFPLLAFFYMVLAEYKARRRDWLWTLPPLMALWVNLHGGFILGLGLMGLYLVCESFRSFMARRQPEAQAREDMVGLEDSTHPTPPVNDTLSIRELSKLAVICALTGVATLANPDGIGIYGFVRSIQESRVVQDQLVEWQPPRIDQWEGILVFYAPFFLALAAMLASGMRLGLTELILLLGAAAFGMKAYRNGIWFALLAAPLMCRALALKLRGWLGPASSEAPDVEPGLPKTPAPATRYRLNYSIAGLLLGFTVLLSPWVYPQMKRTGRTDLLAEGTPVGAMDYLAEHHLQGHIFHSQSYADYLLWRLWPGQHTFVDGRIHLFSDKILNDYRMAFQDPQWQQRLSRYHIRMLLLDKGDGEGRRMIEDARLSPEWQRVYEDELSILFQKTGGD
jgi:hypothetical protein